MKEKVPGPGPRKKLMQEELLTKAAEVFERRGFSQTRIQDIAEALALSRSALYHYFTSKEEILAALIAENIKRQALDLTVLTADREKSPTERLRGALRLTIARRIVGGARLRVLDQLVADMPPDLRRAFERGRRDILDLYIAIIEDGVRRGEFRPVDASVAALAVIGIASWTSWWYSPRGRKTPEEITDILIDAGLTGLVAHHSERVASRQRADLIGEIRADLDRLEKM